MTSKPRRYDKRLIEALLNSIGISKGFANNYCYDPIFLYWLYGHIFIFRVRPICHQKRASRFNFTKVLMLGGVCTAILTGCNQSPTDDPDTIDAAAGGEVATETKSVAITAIVEHPALDDVRKGVVDELAEQGFNDGETTPNFQSAQGNTATAGQIAKQFVADEADVIVAIGTPSAQSVAAATSTIPLVFSAVTDPVEAKLVTTLDGPLLTLQAAPLYEPQIELCQIIPSLKMSATSIAQVRSTRPLRSKT